MEIMDNKDRMLISELKSNLKQAEANKSTHDAYIQEMNRIYKSLYNTDTKQKNRRPSISIKDGQNAVDFIKAKIVSDIMAGNDVIMCFPKMIPEAINNPQLNGNATIAQTLDRKAKNMKNVLEYYWKYGINNVELVRELADKVLVEGTGILKTDYVYDYEYLEEQKEEFIPYENYEAYKQQLEQAGAKITYAGTEDEEMGGYKNLRYRPIRVIEDKPIVSVIDNEDLMRDPAATKLSEARFTYEKYRMTISDIRKLDKDKNDKTGLFENTDKLIDKIKDEGVYPEDHKDSLSTRLDTYDQNFNVEDANNKYARKEITLYEYRGKYDYNEDGIAEWRRIIFCKDVILFNEVIESEVKFPYHVVYSDKHSNEFWGNSPLEKLDDIQQIRTALARSIVQSSALSSIRQRAYNTNAITNPLELKKLKQNIPGTNIGVNGQPGNNIMDLQSPATNQSLYQAYNYFGVESQKALNSADNVQGIGSSASQAETATAARIAASGANTAYEYIFNSFKKGLEGMFRDWSIYVNELTQDNEVITIVVNQNGQKQRQQLTGNQLRGIYDIDVVLTARGVKQNKAQQIIQTFNMITPLIKLGAVESSTMRQLFMKLMDLWDFKDISNRISSNLEQRRSQEYQQDVMKAAKQMAYQLIQDPEVLESLRKDAQNMASGMANQGGSQ